ncbi:MAG: IS66 family transposase [Chitinivibrionales bacterium]|nr:IS66 family transposase [Chitinivibrionales bacterium]
MRHIGCRTVVLPIPKGIADVFLLCFVISSKYRYHLPLYRIQRQIFHESGIWFTRSTMVSWLRYLYKSIRRIHYELLGEYKRSLLKHADESPLKVHLPDVSGRHHEGRMWVGLGKNDHEGPVTAVFHYDKSRSAKAALSFLKGSRPGDILMVDGFEPYTQPVRKYGLIELNCMAHARRKFKEALDTGYKADYCKKMLRKIGHLYRIERFADRKNADTETRGRLRQKYSKKILNEIKDLLQDPGFTVLPSRKVGEAINYMLNHWNKLTTFIDNGLYPIDNNAVERIIRTLAIGRKNWMVAGSENGAKWCAVYYSIFATCLLNGIDPEEYLRDVLMRLAIRPANADVKDLLPVNWAREKGNAQKNVKVQYPEN